MKKTQQVLLVLLVLGTLVSETSGEEEYHRAKSSAPYPSEIMEYLKTNGYNDRRALGNVIPGSTEKTAGAIKDDAELSNYSPSSGDAGKESENRPANGNAMGGGNYENNTNDESHQLSSSTTGTSIDTHHKITYTEYTRMSPSFSRKP